MESELVWKCERGLAAGKSTSNAERIASNDWKRNIALIISFFILV